MSFLVEEIKHKQGEETEKSEVTCGKSLLNGVRENDTQKEEDTITIYSASVWPAAAFPAPFPRC